MCEVTRKKTIVHWRECQPTGKIEAWWGFRCSTVGSTLNTDSS